MLLLKRVTDFLKERGAMDIIVVAGGSIPASDIPSLKAMGISAVFTPGTPSQSILDTLATLLESRRQVV
jgi:methylmalonyl-CoA mutase C-terminal domain/subunit